MSGEVNYRNFGNAKMTSPRYLSDTLTPWCGTLGGTGLSIAYTNLPPDGTIIAKIVDTIATGYDEVGITFKEPQNLNDCMLEFWYKATGIAAANNLLINNVGSNYLYRNIGAPAAWTFYSLNLPRSHSGGTTSKITTAQRIRTITFAGNIAAPWTIEVAGFNVRRL